MMFVLRGRDGDVELAPIDDLEDRDRKARGEAMTVEHEDGSEYTVTSASGSEYAVDVTESSCSCPDHAIRDARCKHLRRVALERDWGTVPDPQN